ARPRPACRGGGRDLYVCDVSSACRRKPPAFGASRLRRGRHVSQRRSCTSALGPRTSPLGPRTSPLGPRTPDPVMYDLIAYAKMLADTVRVRAYADAVRETVREGSVVLDIGTGPGIFALLACRAGAARVYAVEPEPIIGLARTLAQANGCGDRITFIEGSSRTIDLPERVDVMVADIRGQLPLRADALPVLIDARDRHLRAGGTMIPLSDTISGAVVEAPRTYDAAVAGWDAASDGLDFAAAREVATDALWRMAADDGRLLSAPRRWAEIDYRVTRACS